MVSLKVKENLALMYLVLEPQHYSVKIVWNCSWQGLFLRIKKNLEQYLPNSIWATRTLKYSLILIYLWNLNNIQSISRSFTIVMDFFLQWSTAQIFARVFMCIRTYTQMQWKIIQYKTSPALNSLHVQPILQHKNTLFPNTYIVIQTEK